MWSDEGLSVNWNSIISHRWSPQKSIDCVNATERDGNTWWSTGSALRWQVLELLRSSREKRNCFHFVSITVLCLSPAHLFATHRCPLYSFPRFCNTTTKTATAASPSSNGDEAETIRKHLVRVHGQLRCPLPSIHAAHSLQTLLCGSQTLPEAECGRGGADFSCLLPQLLIKLFFFFTFSLSGSSVCLLLIRPLWSHLHKRVFGFKQNGDVEVDELVGLYREWESRMLSDAAASVKILCDPRWDRQF